MYYGIIMVVAGILAAASLVTKKVKDADKFINFLVPFQGWIGIVVFIWGIFGIISSIASIGTTLVNWPIWWITLLAVAIVETLIGFLLGFGLISKYALSKNEEAKKKGEEILGKLAGYQTVLGLIAIGLGLWTIIYYIIR